MRNIVAKNPGLVVLPDIITVNHYGFAVGLEDNEIKTAIDELIQEL